MGLSVIGSSAFAQIGDPQECETLAWNTCHPDPSVPWNVWSFKCWNDTYEACMNAHRSPLVNEPDGVDRRIEAATARR
jgi:hypothetical protein